MDAFVDDRLINKIFEIGTETEAQNKKNILHKTCFKSDILNLEQEIRVRLSWTSFLKFIGLNSLFDNFPKFDDKNKLFDFIKSTIVSSELKKDVLIRLYDQVFVECLTNIKAIPEINAVFLIDQIKEKRKSLLRHQHGINFSDLDRFEKKLAEDTSKTIHDLTLYLAWDRVCVNLAIVFEYFSTDVKISALAVLKDCLIESFEHIASQGKTAPGLFRFIEALFAFEMREENLQTHSDPEWLILCQSARALKPRDDLIEIFYIDEAITEFQNFIQFGEERKLLMGYTMDSPEVIKASLALTNLLIEKIKLQISGLKFTLSPIEVVCIKEREGHLEVNEIIRG